MREVIRYEIKLNPVTKKNHPQLVGIGKQCPVCKKKERMLPIQSKQYLQYEKDCAWFLKPKPTKPIDFPVNVKMSFYMQRNARVDLVNLQGACLDILTKHGILADDSAIKPSVVVSMDGSCVCYDDTKCNARTEIIIQEYGS